MPKAIHITVSAALRRAGHHVKRTGVPRDYPGVAVSKFCLGAWLQMTSVDHDPSSEALAAMVLSEMVETLRGLGYTVNVQPSGLSASVKKD